MGKRAELEPRAIDLYAGGMEIPQISNELRVSENTLYKWRERAGKEWDEARAAFRKGMTGSFEDVGKRVARAREITSQLTGNAASQGAMGQILNESLQVMVFDLMGQIQTGLVDDEEMPKVIKKLNNLALTLQRTESAANLNMRRVKEIRQQALDDVEKGLDEATKTAKAPLTAEDFKRIIRESYGV